MTSKKGGSRLEGGGLGGVFRGLGSLVDFFSDLADKGQHTHLGEISDNKRDVRGIYGFTVWVGDNDRPLIERFGSLSLRRQDVTVDHSRERIVDVFDGDGCVVVVAELPGVAAGDIRYEVKGNELRLGTKSRERRYGTTLGLPCAVTEMGASASFRNGVFELKLPKLVPAPERNP